MSPSPADPAARRLKALVLTAYPAVGGPLPKITPLLVGGLRDCGLDVAVLGWSAHHAGSESTAAKVAGRLGDLARVLWFVARRRPDVVYVATSHGWPSFMRDLPLAAILALARVPFVMHLHGSEADLLGRPGHRLFTRASAWMARRAGAILLLSSEELAPWRRLCPEARFEVVINPFIPSHTAEPVEGRPREAVRTLLLVARLEPGKGVFDALDALARLRERGLCRLVMAGDGPSWDELLAQADRLGLSADLELPGYVGGEDLDRLYARADVFLLPSYRKEGFPLSIMEAMGQGLPIVTTARRGCADVLEPDVHALFVPARDPAALADALERLLDDEGMRQRMGRANLEKVKEFSPDHVVPKYAQVLRSVVRDRDGGQEESAGAGA
jgi:glycosyltransferase involved in cell wall biosynthesis